jgi:hypothetical protein
MRAGWRAVQRAARRGGSIQGSVGRKPSVFIHQVKTRRPQVTRELAPATLHHMVCKRRALNLRVICQKCMIIGSPLRIILIGDPLRRVRGPAPKLGRPTCPARGGTALQS